MPMRGRKSNYRRYLKAKLRRRAGKLKRNYNRQKIHRFTRTFNIDTAIILNSGAAAAGYGYTFKLNDLPNPTDFTQL